MQIYMLITNKCNLSCSICIRVSDCSDTIEMDYKTYTETLLANDFSNADIIITGGEPTMHDSFCEIVDFTCRYAKNVSVTTNGTMAYYIDSLSNKENLSFQVSLDGDEITNDAIRGVGAYSRIANTLNKFEKHHINYCVASVVSKKNKDSIKNLVPFLSSLKSMQNWRISYEMPFGNSGFSDMLTADEWNSFVDDIIKSVNFRLRIQKIFPFKLYDKKILEAEGFELQSKRCFNCGSGRDKIYVYPDYSVYSCTCLTDFCLGNLKENTFEDIILGNEIKKFSEYKIDSDVPCSECKYYAFCKGGCIGMSYHYFGLIGKGDIRCPILRSYYEQKGFLL